MMLGPRPQPPRPEWQPPRPKVTPPLADPVPEPEVVAEREFLMMARLRGPDGPDPEPPDVSTNVAGPQNTLVSGPDVLIDKREIAPGGFLEAALSAGPQSELTSKPEVLTEKITTEAFLALFLPSELLEAKNERIQKQGTTFGQQLQHERELRGWTRKQLASRLRLSNAAIRRWEENRGVPDPVSRQKLAKLFGYTSEQQRQTFVQQKAEGGLTAFFSSLGDGVAKLISGSVKTVVSTLLGAALFPILGPVGAGAIVLGAIALTTSLQDESARPAFHLQQSTVDKLVERFPDKQFDERQLRKVIEEVLSQDKQANRDLAQFFIDLVPSIQKTAATHFHISGPVQGLVIGDHNKITQTFNSFLSKPDISDKI